MNVSRIPVAGAVLSGLLLSSVLVAFHLERKAPLGLRGVEEPLGKIEAALEAKRRPKWLETLRSACRKRDCDCARIAAGFGLDVEANDAVLSLVELARACEPKVVFDGLRVEALVRKEDPSGPQKAAAVLARSSDNPNALYAQALAAYRVGEHSTAKELAQASERGGRGWSATLLVGLVAYHANDLEGSRRAFRALLALDPDDVDALFNLGVAAQKERRYGEARSSYLRATRVFPGHVDARYNLALLAHSVGAAAEGRHHLEKLRKMEPNNPRVRELEAALAKPPDHPPTQVLSVP